MYCVYSNKFVHKYMYVTGRALEEEGLFIFYAFNLYNLDIIQLRNLSKPLYDKDKLRKVK